ncbi:MAG: glycosyl hydrolase-related protein [Candidatus Atabeyarchaeum deiterrae]
MDDDLDLSQRKKGGESENRFNLVYFVNHSHMDNTWAGTPQECLERNLDIIGEVLDVCKQNPEFRFSLENVYPLHEFIGRHSERVVDVADLIKAGRLEVGGEYIHPTVDYCYDECIARNLYYGKGWLKHSFDYDTKLVYEEDVPGHTLQMPQILKKTGVRYFKISRGPPSIFYWVAPDGSSVLTYVAEYSWSHHSLLGYSPEETLTRLPTELERASKNYRISELMIPDGDDLTSPNPELLEIVRVWNEKVGKPGLKLGTAQEFLSSVEKHEKVPVLSGDMPNQWVGVSTVEAETIRRLRSIQNMTFSTEEFMSISSLLGGEYNSADMEEAWRLILLTADHNWGGKDPTRHGEFSDEEKLRYLKRAKTLCKKQLDRALENIASKIDATSPNSEEIPLVVFNQLPWSRTDVIEFEVDNQVDPTKIQISSHDGGYVPSQTMIIGEVEDQKKLRVSFVAEDVPPTGYKTFFVNFNASSQNVETLLRAEDSTLENRWVKLEVDRSGRGISRFFDKERGTEIGGERQCALGPMRFNFLLNELFGMGLKLTIKPVPTVLDRTNDLITVDPTGDLFRADKYPCSVTIVENGPVKATILVEGKFIDSVKRQEITIYERLNRVDLRTTLEWSGKNFVAVMLMLPLNLEPPTSMVVNVPYAAVNFSDIVPGFWVKPTDPVQFKVRGVQHWVDIADSGGGATLLTNWPCFDFTMAPAAIILWSMDNERSFFSGERYRQKGTHTLTFSIIPHRGGWRASQAYRQGLSIAFPLISVMTPQHSAFLPREMSFMRVDVSNIIVTALKKAENKEGFIVRLYEAEGLEKNFTIEFHRDVKECWETNLLEENVKKLTTHEHRVDLAISPSEIKTIRVIFREL